jgi:hypothetical protein
MSDRNIQNAPPGTVEAVQVNFIASAETIAYYLARGWEVVGHTTFQPSRRAPGWVGPQSALTFRKAS